MNHPDIAVANAPVSYGAFEVTVGVNPNVPDGTALLNAVAEAGYAGIDLGPVGYLGETTELGRRLADRGLALAGGYIEFSFHDHEQVESMMPELDTLLDAFDAAVATGAPAPKPTIADAGSDARRAAPGGGSTDSGLALSVDGWAAQADGLMRVVERCRARGYDPTLHCETGSYLESTEELERALTMTDVSICLETGHQTLGGGNPLEFASQWAHRINHVHLKDVNLTVFNQIRHEGLPTSEIWAREAFPRLGEGDVPIAAIVDELVRNNFAGWVVVEQDIFPSTPERFARAIADQKANREFLAARGL